MTDLRDSFHALPGSLSDLQLFTRFWEWERKIETELPRVVEQGNIEMVFQPIFRITQESAEPCGYEALARFPTAPEVPVGLWFRIAAETGLARDLELLAAENAIDSRRLLPIDGFLNVNASPQTALELVHLISPVGVTLVIDIAYNPALPASELHAIAVLLQASGVQMSLDDTPLDQLHHLKSAICHIRPDYLKVDVLAGLHDNPMGRFNLAQAATWCQDEDITLLAERVESVQDLELLKDLGVQMAQGYSLAKPV